MKINEGSSFFIKKAFMSDDELKEYHKMQKKADKGDTFGETDNFLFGNVMNETEFYEWLSGKKFVGIEWGC